MSVLQVCVCVVVFFCIFFIHFLFFIAFVCVCVIFVFAVAAHQTSETNAASEKCLNNKISHATTMQQTEKSKKKIK